MRGGVGYQIHSAWYKDKENFIFHVLQINVWLGQPQPYETVPIRIRTILSSANIGSEAPRENHQALAVKNERHPTCDTEWNPCCSSKDLNPGHSGERQMFFHGATKPPTYKKSARSVVSFIT